MAYAANRFESGTAGSSVTTGNSGTNLDRAWDSVTGTVTYSSTHAAHGTRSARVSLAAETAAQARWSDAEETDSTCYTRMYVWADSVPPANARLIQYHDATGLLLASVRWRADGTLDVLDGSSTQLGQSAGTLPTGQWIRLEAKVVPGAGTGSAEVRIYTTDPDGTTPDETVTSDDTGVLGTGYGGWRWGVAGPSMTWTAYIDDVGVNFTDWLGPALVLAPSGVGSTAGVGSPTLAFPTQDVDPSGIASSAAVGGPKIRIGLTAEGIASTAAIGEPTLAQEIAFTGIEPTSAVGTPGLGLTVTPTGIAGTSAVGEPEVSTPDPTLILPVGIAPTSQVGFLVINSPEDDWMYGSEIQFELNRIAHTTGLGEAEAANRIAGTTSLETVAALNVAAGTEETELDFQGVCNALAGTEGLGPAAALSAVVA